FREGKHIRLVSVLTDPVEYMLRNSKSTGTMNYLTGTHAVSLFPRTTFVARTLVHCQDTSRSPVSHQTWTNKYRARGFSVVDAGVTLPNIRELRKWERRVGDKLTWVLPYKRIGTAERPPIQMRSYAFEVLDVTTEVTAAGAALRVGPRFWYSSMAYMRKPMKSFSQYRSIETAAAFLQDFWVPVHGNFGPDWDTDTDTESTDSQGASEADSDQKLEIAMRIFIVTVNAGFGFADMPHSTQPIGTEERDTTADCTPAMESRGAVRNPLRGGTAGVLNMVEFQGRGVPHMHLCTGSLSMPESANP
ncbi:hypothetical protein K466DRAFT_619003, partial [Polyporus arcularius HHB13444]